MFLPEKPFGAQREAWTECILGLIVSFIGFIFSILGLIVRNKSFTSDLRGVEVVTLRLAIFFLWYIIFFFAVMHMVMYMLSEENLQYRCVYKIRIPGFDYTPH